MQAEKYKTFISKVNFEDNRPIIDRLNKIMRFIIELGLVLIAVFSLIAVLVIFNTIALTIYNRREEIEVMKLVGATNWYVRGPFLIESLLYSITATIITAILLVPIFFNILPKIAAFIGAQASALNYHIFNYWTLVLALFIVSLILAIFSTLLAIRKYLKV